MLWSDRYMVSGYPCYNNITRSGYGTVFMGIVFVIFTISSMNDSVNGLMITGKKGGG